jgi:hypothetical protein
MTAPAVVALRCTIANDVERIDRGEILYATYTPGKLVPELGRDGSIDGSSPIVTAEAVTLHKSQRGREVSVPIVILGKSEVILRRRVDGDVTQEWKADTTIPHDRQPGTPLYFKYEGNKTVISAKKTDNFLGTLVHGIGPTTYSVDMIMNFAK